MGGIANATQPNGFFTSEIFAFTWLYMSICLVHMASSTARRSWRRWFPGVRKAGSSLPARSQRRNVLVVTPGMVATVPIAVHPAMLRVGFAERFARVGGNAPNCHAY